MNYVIDKKKHEPAYLQLYRLMAEDIVSGVYPYGTRLPSKRTLAEETGVSLITAEHALSLLSDEGYIETRERSGAYVIYRNHDFQGQPAPVKESSLPTSAVPVRHRASDFPFGILARTMRKVILDRGEQLLVASPGKGAEALREAIAAYLGRSRGLKVTAEQIIIGSGAEYLYTMIALLFGPGTRAALEEPSYVKIRKVYEAMGLICEGLTLDHDGIRSRELKKTDARILHVTPFNSFPSGITAGISKKLEYLAWGKGEDRIIIEDNYDSELTVSSKPEDALFSLSKGEGVIYLNTFSRTIAPSLRLGYMVLPTSLLTLYEEKLGFFSCTVPIFEQYVLAELIENGEYERHINRVRRRRRKDLKVPS